MSETLDTGEILVCSELGDEQGKWQMRFTQNLVEDFGFQFKGSRQALKNDQQNSERGDKEMKMVPKVF